MLSEVARRKLRAGHYSRRTEEAYLGWIARFIRFHGRRHPRELGPAEVVAFLEELAGTGLGFDAESGVERADVPLPAGVGGGVGCVGGSLRGRSGRGGCRWCCLTHLAAARAWPLGC